MNDREIYLAWIPNGVLWSRWAKSVLFAHLNERSARPPSSNVRLELSQVVPPNVLDASYRENARRADVAVIADLHANDVVHAGIELAQLGFRPVPLFNALPSLGPVIRAAVNVDPIITSLAELAPKLAETHLAVDASPAFLLHADRRGTSPPRAGWLDNRSLCMPADFPSGAELYSRGIRHVVVVQPDGNTSFAPDLREILFGFQAAGLEMHVTNARVGSKPSAFRVKKAWFIARIFRAIGTMTMVRTKEGAFGHVVSSGG